ncbi:glycosyl transferase, family 2 [hydrocarbon metagenome]|uniref:Glycosyl transferase, family 2 n=1 Tax=hydrocarbon metagenome TaxID=938273 RepID=A0A0W8FLR5_9ZZZZ
MFNEAENIGNTIARASALARELTDDYEIIVVDDASTDKSVETVKSIAKKDSHIRIVCLNVNTKMGGAIKEGLKNAAKEVIIYTDSDFPAKEEDIKNALGILRDVDIVTSYSLVIKDRKLIRIIMSKTYNILVQFFFGLNIPDVNGALKIYKKEVLTVINPKSNSPFIHPEIFAEAVKNGFKIKKYGIIFEPRTKGKSSVAKINVIARTISDMLIYKFSR